MTNDSSTVRLVIAALAVLAVTTVVGGIALAFDDKSLPGELIAIGSAAAGAIGGILSRTGTNGPTPVEVVNRNANPVPVNEAGQANVLDLVVVVLVVVLLVFLILRVAGT